MMMGPHNLPLRFAIYLVSSLLFCSFATAQAQSGGDLRAATQNPISTMYSLPFKFTFDNGAENGDANILAIQPVPAPARRARSRSYVSPWTIKP